MNKYLFLIPLTLCSMRSMASVNNELQKVVYAIPGQNGQGSSSSYIQSVLGSYDIHQVETPSLLPDLGQRFCQRHLGRALEWGNGKPGIVYATSQGTATALNYLSNYPEDNQIKALVLESSFASGNNVIHNTFTHIFKKDFFGSSCITPYLSSLSICRGYRPGGQQPIFSVNKIPTSTPIILTHSHDDQCIPIEETYALYYKLRDMGNHNTYLLCPKGTLHTSILQNDSEAQKVIRRILNQHDLSIDSQPKEAMDNFQAYQPDHLPFKKMALAQQNK